MILRLIYQSSDNILDKVHKMHDLTKNNALNLKSEASEFFHFETEHDLIKILDRAEDDHKQLQIIGSGTNTIFPRHFAKIVIKSTNNNFKYSEEGNSVLLEVGAAVEWDDLIDFCCNKRIFGLENLAGIPGTVGAAPIQNIGAYGLEVSRFIDFVECFDTELRITRKIKPENCEFGYRKSMFQNASNLIVLAVGFRLKKDFEPILEHESLKDSSFSKAQDMIDEIRKIRNAKLPNPKDFPNLGSFFKNPIISSEDADSNLKLEGLKKYHLPENKVKFSAGEMLDKLSLKGMKIRNIGLWHQHALVLTSNGIVSAQDIKHVEDLLKNYVIEHYGIQLEREPTYL